MATETIHDDPFIAAHDAAQIKLSRAKAVADVLMMQGGDSLADHTMEELAGIIFDMMIAARDDLDAMFKAHRAAARSAGGDA